MKSISRILLLALLSISLICAFAVSAMATDGEAESIPEGAAFKYTSASGDVSYHAAEEFATMALKGGTIQLLTDLYTECETLVLSKSLTIDLNGHALKRCFVYGNVYEATSDGNGGYVCEATGTPTTISATGAFFKTNAASITLHITSTVGGGDLYSVDMKADTWTYNGEVVKRTTTGYYSNTLISVNKKNITLKLDGGITTYIYSFFKQIERGTSGHLVDIDGIRSYKIVNGDHTGGAGYRASISMMNLNSNEISLKNSQFIFPSGSHTMLYLGTSEKYPSYDNTFDKVTVTNCDFVKPVGSNAFYMYESRYNDPTYDINFENCRLYDVLFSGKSTMALGNYYTTGKDSDNQTLSNPGLRDGYTAVTVSKKVTYDFLKSAAFAANTDSDINTINFGFETSAKTLTFNRLASKTATVNWYDTDGELLESSTLTPALDTLTPPELDNIEYNDYLDIAYQWADAKEGGNALPEAFGYNGDKFEYKEVYDFYATTELNGEVKYVANLKDARISLSYVGQFWIYIYLPYEEGMQAPAIDGKTLTSTVLIDGKKFYYNTYYLATATVLDNKTRTVTFYDANGAKYSKNITVGGLIYAEQVFANADYYAEELESVANMLRYSREAYELRSANDASVKESLEANGSRIDALIGTANADGSTSGGQYDLPAYVTEFENAPKINVYDYSDYVYSIQFVMVGSSARVKITLTDAVEGMKVTKIYANGYSSGLADPTTTKVTDPETGETVTLNAWYDKNQKVYNAVGKFEFDILVPAHTDANGDEVAQKTIKVTYSMAEYITVMQRDYPETDIEIARAMYAFGVAAGDYVKNLTNY